MFAHSGWHRGRIRARDIRTTFQEYLLLRTSGGSILLRLLVTAGVAYFAGGFLYGALFREPYTGFMERIYAGIGWAFLSAIYLGVPPTDDGGVGHLTTWPLIIGCWAVLFFGWLYADYVTDLFHRKTPHSGERT